MSTLTTTNPCSAAIDSVGSRKSWVASLLGKFRCDLLQRAVERRTRAHLHRLDDHLLRDIGIARGDIDVLPFE